MKRSCEREFLVFHETAMTYVSLRLVDESGAPIAFSGTDGATVLDEVGDLFRFGDLVVLGYGHLEFNPMAVGDMRVGYGADTMHLRIPFPSLENVYLGDVQFSPGSFYLSLPGADPHIDTAYAHRASADGVVNGRRLDGRYVDSILRAERELFREGFLPDTSFKAVASATNAEGRTSPYCYRVVMNRAPRRDTVFTPDAYAHFVLNQRFFLMPPRAIIPFTETE